MHYVTHYFANLETLSRARRWLAQLGFDPGQIESHTDGVPRLALMVKPGQVDEVQLLINAAELTDPAGWPSFWDVAQQTHVYPCESEPVAALELHQAHSTEVGWHPPDADASARDNSPLHEVWDVMERFA
jgi:hypothetical protein